jgi:hypothetical protein
MTDDERWLLELLAASYDGCTEAILLAHGFALDLIDGIVSAGLATATAEHTFAAGRAIEFTRADHGSRSASAGGTAGVGWQPSRPSDRSPPS